MLYLDYTFDSGNIEKGLFRSALLLKVSRAISNGQHCLFETKAFKHIFTSPSSAKEVEGDGNGADAIMASQHRRTSESDAATRSHVANIIGMKMVTPRSIAYTACQVCATAFAYFSPSRLILPTASVFPLQCQLLAEC